MVDRSGLHYSEINRKRNCKKDMQFPLELLKNETSQAPSLALQKIY